MIPMLSHVVGGSGAQNVPSGYVPNGQPTATFPPANHYHQIHHQFTNSYGVNGEQQQKSLPLQTMQPPEAAPATVRTQNNVVVNRAHPETNVNNNRARTANNHQWYQPPQTPYNYGANSNSREMRNKAEKQRRDRLNAFIAELAGLVPMVSKSAKRMDKTSILRLTATHLRIYQTLVKGKGAPHMELPPQVDQDVLEQLICDQMGGFLLITCTNGKIIFVSPTVETLLGHLQTDLMGQSLFTVTASEDHDRLRMYLGSEGEMEQGWKKYFNIKVRRAGPKSETPQYELVSMMGLHRNMSVLEQASTSASGNSSPMSSAASTSSIQTSLNTDILIFFVKLCRPQPLVDRLVAASKDEYVTRHLIDGRIIGCDQRIALIAGYMIEEIQGHSAFQYMHREDVRFVMIALRQMYDKGESRGNSCYRLKSRNGQFIYLKTFGFLEIDDQGIVESFICVNVQVDENEGVHHISEMKRRYSALFTSSLASLPYQDDGNSSDGSNVGNMTWMSPASVALAASRLDRTEDPQALQAALNELMQNLPSPGSEETDTEHPVKVETPESPVAPPSVGKVMPESTCTSTATSKHPYLRMKSSGKRASTASPDPVKRQRLTSVDSECSQLSPVSTCSSTQPQPHQTEPHLCKIPKLEEQYLSSTADMMRHQHHHAT
ncbi:unnamed protein product [Ceutorhynchus assimilis]|uniref:Methoprene-tolerant protein n=1 Tax=Ceutorhynchus assimilis TaxID=467358 RepID=A0A9P0DGR1_9CUCU|nr:unnamed protein product [Ceutorhynchus assimilis]